MSNIDYKHIHTLGELKKAGWTSVSVKEEIRQNLIRKLQADEPIFPGILGYDQTVIPQIEHALLSRHDFILLGLRGQAKSKILRMLPSLLDEYIPVVEGSDIMDDPFQPLSKFARDKVATQGDKTPIVWVHRSNRYGEKLATPDTTVADLIGDLDPIKAASQKLSLSNEDVINFGLIPRVNRGIFTINELPDLQPRIQVALLNILQERDVQIRGFNIRFPLDVLLAFSANPEDYTNRGNIITPLKDRIDAQIITHYPKTLEVGMNITQQEASQWREETPIRIPQFMRGIIEQVAVEARNSEYIDQKSGVSTRLSITGMEQAIAAAERRMIMNNEEQTTLRIADLYHMVPALTGKLELVYEGEQEGAINVAKHLIGTAIKRRFADFFPNPQPRKAERRTYGEYTEALGEGEQKGEEAYSDIMGWFSDGNTLEITDQMPEKEYQAVLNKVDGLASCAKKYGDAFEKEDPYILMEWIIEALHQFSKLGKEDLDEIRTYSDMVGSVLGGLDDFDDEDFDY
ncbi:MAG: magnesium chelatase [Bacteroidota bacterium]